MFVVCLGKSIAKRDRRKAFEGGGGNKVEIRKQTPKRSRQPEDASLLRFISECSGISFHVLVGLAWQSPSLSHSLYPALLLLLSLARSLPQAGV